MWSNEETSAIAVSFPSHFVAHRTQTKPDRFHLRFSVEQSLAILISNGGTFSVKISAAYGFSGVAARYTKQRLAEMHIEIAN